MLVISRKSTEWIDVVGIGRIHVGDMRGGEVKLAFDFPRDVRILRGELKDHGERGRAVIIAPRHKPFMPRRAG